MTKELKVEVGKLTIFGREKAAGKSPRQGKLPLIVAIHGGGFTSAYFDCGEFSLLSRASAAGCPSIGLDRPGYGSSSRIPDGDRAIQRNAEVLQDVITRAWRKRSEHVNGVVLVGHSIGSAIALHMASQAAEWPLLGVTFSGLGISSPPHLPPFWNDRGLQEWVHAPWEFRKTLMFGPPGTYAAGAPESSDAISKPAWWREIVEISTSWKQDYVSVCANIRVPVLYRQGERDTLWWNTQEEVDRFARAFVHAPTVDAKILPNTGHCIDFHLAGKSFQEEQISFALDCSSRAPAVAAD